MSVFRNLLMKKGSAQEANGRIPSQYQEVEYIDNKGNGYINTGILPTQNTNIDICFSVNSYRYQSLFYAAQSSSVAYTLIMTTEGNNGTYIYAYGDSGKNYWTPLETNKITRYKTCYGGLYHNTGIHIRKSKKDSDFPTFSIFNPLMIFASYNPSTLSVNNIADAKLYEGKIKNNYEYIAYLIPCYRKSDGKVGVYDMTREIFIDGIGIWEAGPEVYYEVNTDANGYPYVDLGVTIGGKPVYFAKTNLTLNGLANKEEDYGDRFWVNNLGDQASEILGGTWTKDCEDAYRALFSSEFKWEDFYVNGIKGTKISRVDNPTKYIFLPYNGGYNGGTIYWEHYTGTYLIQSEAYQVLGIMEYGLNNYTNDRFAIEEYAMESDGFSIHPVLMPWKKI